MTPSEMTLDELRPVLVREMLPDIAFDGWTIRAAEAAAERLGVPAERARLCFPRRERDMIEGWVELSDADMVEAMAREGVADMKIRDRIRRGVEIRLEQAAPYREAVREALKILGRPQNAAYAARSLWRTADRMWRAAGDTATDLNHYTKRATLSGVYSSTLIYWLQDDSEEFAETRAFLDRRIDDVMKIEKAKAEIRKARGNLPNPIRFLGRLRYPGV
ncbi:hypothetical protein B5C34_08670 [Pacificimonas flava]|uniref:COQ9 C-terminal domain-containing protein n=3 Tax=Sphingosinicellaceae TaxID=2820280 RepID=A0A219B8L4_9SPHN|nr:COQ9 family protein [Pacificimonas flava]MBZ6379264.1 COQ9 family protein [Pacificimonas aurantium]OWV34705.1 hypothetical protein B5C34_08670 [Pacificimonas flava]